MTTDEMITHLQSLLGKIGTVLDTQILQELKLAQIFLESRGELPWFLLKEKYASTVADEARLAIPTDFLLEAEESALWYVTSEGAFKVIKKGEQDTLRAYWNNDGTSDDDTKGPRAYALVNGYFFLYPTPGEVYTVRMYYYASDTVLATGDSGNLWSTHFPDLLMGLAGQNLLVHFRENDPNVISRVNSMAAAGERRLIGKITAREMANMEMSYGGG